jgi:hypothetical protein
VGVLASRSLIAATAVWLGVLAAVYAADAGPPRQAMAFTAAVLFAASAWAGAAQLGAGSVDLRAVLTAATGRSRVLVVDLLLAGGWVVGATLAGVLAPVAFDPHPVSGGDMVVGAILHLECGMTGVALALLLRAAGTSRGVQAVVVLLAALASGRLEGLPPVGPVMAAWGTGRGVPTGLAVWSLVGPVVLAGLLLACTVAVRRRRG